MEGRAIAATDSGFRRELELGLKAALPGFEILDRELVLGERASADLVGVDADQRLILVLFGEDTDDATTLLALDALAFARTNLELLARHFSPERVRTDRTPGIVLVGTSFSSELVMRLAPLSGAVQLLEVRELQSSAASTVYLVPVAADASDVPTATPPFGAEAFLDGLSEDLRATADVVVQRLARVDADLACSSTNNGIEWRFGDELVCRIAAVDGRLEAAPSRAGAVIGIGSVRDVDAFLDRTLARYVDLLRDGAAQGPEPGETAGESGPPDDEDLAEIEIVPRSPGAILTREEIEAFRQ